VWISDFPVNFGRKTNSGLRKTEIPFKSEVLAFGIARNTFAVATELWIVRREKQESGMYASTELVDQTANF